MGLSGSRGEVGLSMKLLNGSPIRNLMLETVAKRKKKKRKLKTKQMSLGKYLTFLFLMWEIADGRKCVEL